MSADKDGRFVQRNRRIYWVEKPASGKPLLVFDGGYPGGDIHIYEYKESIPSDKAISEVETYLKHEVAKEVMPDVIRLWVEQKMGHNLGYDIK
jgi:hypothetical protein